MRYAQNSQNFESTTSYATIWSDTDWNKTQKYVDKQRFRIFRAESEGETRKVRDLQRMLVYSPATLKVAIKRVTQINKGKKTPGLDGFRALNDSERGKLFLKMKDMNIDLYKPKPVNRIQIPKKNGKTRSLGIPVVMDRVYQEMIRLILEPQGEFRFEPTSYGFRPKRGAHDAMARIFHNVRRGNWVYVFEGDFKSCFDTLNHDFILKQLNGFPYCNVVDKFLKAGYMEDNVFFRTPQGTPQGGLLSPLLANIALTGMEDCLGITYRKRKGSNGAETFETQGNYRITRYADDFVIFAKSKEDIEQVPPLLEPYLNERGLILAEDKTRITHVSEGFNFLGFETRQQKPGKKQCNIKPSKDSINGAKRKLSDTYKRMNGHNVGELISTVNPILEGIGNYWKPMVASYAFAKVDYHVWNLTKKFVTRLHPHKSWKWITKRYFPTPDKNAKHQDKWILTDPITGNQLKKMSWIDIERHIMIKHNYSPLDKSKSDYFRQRDISTSRKLR